MRITLTCLVHTVFYYMPDIMSQLFTSIFYRYLFWRNINLATTDLQIWSPETGPFCNMYRFFAFPESTFYTPSRWWLYPGSYCVHKICIYTVIKLFFNNITRKCSSSHPCWTYMLRSLSQCHWSHLCLTFLMHLPLTHSLLWFMIISSDLLWRGASNYNVSTSIFLWGHCLPTYQLGQ